MPLAFLLVFAIQFLQAQSPKIDSLNALISKAFSDTQRINLVLAKLYLLSNVSLDSAIALAKQTLPVARKLNYYKGEFNLRVSLTSNYAFKGDFIAAAEQLNYLDNFTRPANDSLDYAVLFGTKGLLYGIRSKYDSSIPWYINAVRIYERNKSKDKLPRTYGNLAIGYQQEGNFSQALAYQQKALSLADENQDEPARARTLVNIANTYESLRDTTRALQTFFKAIEIAKKNRLVNVELYSYSNLSDLFSNQGKKQQAYEFALKALPLAHILGDKGMEAASMAKAATALAQLNRVSEAEAMARSAIQIADSSTQPFNIYQAYGAMGEVQVAKENYGSAIQFFEKGIAALQRSAIYEAGNVEVYKHLSLAYEKTGNYSKALANYKLATAIADSLHKKDNIRKATELTMNFEFDKTQAIAKAAQDKKDADAKRVKSQQLSYILALSGIALAVLIIALLLLKNNKQKQKVNSALQHQKEKVESTLTELKITQAQLVQSEKMASLGELTAGIAHEIQNPLNFVNNFSDINKELLEELKEELDRGNIEDVRTIANNVIDNETKINHHGKRADSIVKGMLQHSRTSTGKKELTDINKLADEYLRLSYHGLRAKDKSFNAAFKTDFDKRVGQIDIMPQDVGRVLLNLFNNAFYAVNEKKKASNSGFEPTVTVSTMKTATGVEINVADNGTGIPQAALNKIYQPFFTTKPTGEGTGLGLSLSYDIVTKSHGGQLAVETKEGEGTVFKINLPA